MMKWLEPRKGGGCLAVGDAAEEEEEWRFDSLADALKDALADDSGCRRCCMRIA